MSAVFSWPWEERHRRYRIFSINEAPRRIASACLSEDTNPVEVLTALGMGGGRMSGGMAASAYATAVELLSGALSRPTPDEHHLGVALTWSVESGRLRYPAHRVSLAEALLLPWSERAPSEKIQERISQFILLHFKDPRLPFNAHGWLGVGDEAKAIMRRWMTAANLEQFFEVVDNVAQENMWRYRRAFWGAYFDAGYITDAWVLFGPTALQYARNAFEGAQSYGVLEHRSQVLRDHSVLLMKIGKLTVADWSHSGKCHIWLDGNPKAPKLYLRSYSRSEVVDSSDNEGQAHRGSENGTWQRQIRTFIRNNSGISVSNYMPTAGQF